MSYRGGPLTIDQRVARIEERLRRGESAIAATVVVTDHGLLDGLGDDDHTQYQLRAEQGAPGGYPDLDGGGVVPKAQLPGDVVYATSTADLETLLWLTMGMEA